MSYLTEGFEVRSAKTPRAMQIDQLVYFIQQADIENARRTLVDFLQRGEPVSREIVKAYEQLERGFPSDIE